MSKRTWADVSKGDVVEMNGRAWRVVKIKPGKKRATVMLEHKGRYSEGVVKLTDKAPIVPVMDHAGTQKRWATKSELDETLARGLSKGNPAQVKPPVKAKGDPWETQADRIEKRLDDLLSARLVGEATDESAGYYVPPVDVTTIAAHLAIFHGGIPEACDDDEAKMLVAHTAQHAAVLKGEGVLEVNHWHTPKRPNPSERQ